MKRKLTFLLDNLDTLAAYEEKGRANNVDSQEAGFQAMFDQLNRVQQVEMIQRKQPIQHITIIQYISADYKNLKAELSSFFKGFAEEGRVELILQNIYITRTLYTDN